MAVDARAHNIFLENALLTRIAGFYPRSLHESLTQLGTELGKPDMVERARLASQNPPRYFMHTHNNSRFDSFDIHPALHELRQLSRAQGITGSLWQAQNHDQMGRHIARAMRLYLLAGCEYSHLKSLSTTSAALAMLVGDQTIPQDWSMKAHSQSYDPRVLPYNHKNALTLTLALDENHYRTGGYRQSVAKQAKNQASNAPNWNIFAAKSAVVAPDSDGFIVLAQTPQGLSSFLVPRLIPNGKNNALYVDQIQPPLGTQAVATLSFMGSYGWLIGSPGQGTQNIEDMQTLLRFDRTVINAALAHKMIKNAVTAQRQHNKTFAQSLNIQILADMALDVAALTALTMRLASSFDLAAQDHGHAAFARIMTPVANYWSSRLLPNIAYETAAMLDKSDASQLNQDNLHHYLLGEFSVDQGGNGLALDIANLYGRAPNLFEMVFNDIAAASPVIAKASGDVLRAAAQIAAQDQTAARIFIEQLALASAASQLTTMAGGSVATAFTESRLGGLWRSSYGMLTGRYNFAALIDALYPPL